jgi:hypothetical protein
MSYNYYYDEQSQDATSSQSEVAYQQESQEQAGYPRMMSSTPSDVMDVVADTESGAQYQQDTQYSSDDSESAA